MSKLSEEFQEKYRTHQLFDTSIIDDIDKEAKLHNEALNNPLSSAASCLNVLGSIKDNPEEIKRFLAVIGLEVDRVIEFPTGANIGERLYNDKGYIIFEWIGPKESPINEGSGGGRGQNRTSIDAYILVELDNKITQLLIEWKFTEGKSKPFATQKFSGYQGLERLRRYSQILVGMRNQDNFPFDFKESTGVGLHDFSVDHLYQLMRITLLAKTTTPIQIGEHYVEDYRVIHISHSQNKESRYLNNKHLKYSPGLQDYENMEYHEAWKDILTDYEKRKFIGGYWDKAIDVINDDKLRNYLKNRYFEA